MVCAPRPVNVPGLMRRTRGPRVALAGAGASSRFTDSKPCIMSRYKPLARSDLVTVLGGARVGQAIWPEPGSGRAGPVRTPDPSLRTIPSHETSNGGKEGRR
jgi:hypothetical protein